MRKEVILILHIGYALGSITVAPRNAAVVAGGGMSMGCLTNKESRVSKWDLWRVGGETISVYRHGDPSQFHLAFTHFGAQVNVNGSGILYTNSTRMGDAGLYTCVTREGSSGKTIRVSAHLTVFESQPICETNLTSFTKKSLAVGDFIWFRCSVSFRGFWTPTMEWRQHSGNGDMGNILTGGVELLRLPNASVISTLTIKGHSSVKNMSYSCRTYFTDYDGIAFSDAANNIPNFNYTWSSEAIELPNYQVEETAVVGLYSSILLVVLLVVCLSVLSVFVIIAVTVLCISKRERVRDGRPSMQLDQSIHEPHPTAELNSETVETEGREMAATNAGYCSLTDVSQEPKVYCPLRLQVPQNSDYVNLPSNQQRLPNEFPVYCNVTHM